ncbi:MAG: IS66-like element ISH10B family transposase [Chloroflexota bacterium]
MTEHLSLGSLDAPTLRMLLTQERGRIEELEQEVARLCAGLARQNERIGQLEQENADLRRENRALRAVMAGLQEQNSLLRQQVAALQAENARLAGPPRPPKRQAEPWPSEHTKQEAESTPRTTRDRRHNHGRQRMERVDETVIHAEESCPRCGHRLVGGWVHRRVQVIELPSPVGAQVIEHLLIRRQCPHCRHRSVPRVPSLAHHRLGQCRFGPRLVATIATMRTVERLPIRQIQERLHREYALDLSVGGIVGLLHLAAQKGTPRYARIKADIRGSPVVHADETGWREDGIPGYIWTISTPDACLFHRDPSRAMTVADAVLGSDFAGILVSDFYAAYDHFEGEKQRCWAHLWRDIDALENEVPDDEELAAWVAGVRVIYDLAIGERPEKEQGQTPEAIRARARRAASFEQQLLALCPETLSPDRPEATLAKRMRRYAAELFTFVADPAVPHTNNAAERNLRPLVIARKVSGGTRSSHGSTDRMILHSLATTARLQGADPTATFLAVLSAPTESAESHTL